MGDLDEDEINYTRFRWGICSLNELKKMKEKYKDRPIAIKIQKKIEEIEDEYVR